MITIELDKLVRLFGFWKDDSAQVWHELVNINTNLSEKYSKPFKRELLNNLVSKDSSDWKIDVIKYYLIVLKEALYIPEELHGLIHTGSEGIFISVTEGEIEANTDSAADPDVDFGPCKIIAPRSYKANPENDSFFYFFGHSRHLSLQTLILGEIYFLCNHFKIAFKKLCGEIDFPEESLFFLKLFETENTKSNNQALEGPIIDHEELHAMETMPIFTSEFIPEIFSILKNFFMESNHAEFLRMLKTGEDAEKPLLFKDSGKRLTDAFKQLYNAEIIKGCQKKELEAWICRNFHYRHRGALKTFSMKYVANVISSKDDNCAKPIFNVVKDKTTGQYLIRIA